MKTDDDVFVNIFAIVQHLFDLEHSLSPFAPAATMTLPHSTSGDQMHHHWTASLSPSAAAAAASAVAASSSPMANGSAPTAGLIICLLWKNPPVARRGKWAVTKTEFADATYPSYCSGVGFIMTPDVPGRLLRQAVDASPPNEPPFWIDDAYLTGLLVRGLNGTVRLKDMSKAFCKTDKMAVLYGHPSEWYKYAFTHVGGLDSPGNSNARLYEETWNKLLWLATNDTATSVIPRPRVVRPGRLANRYKSYRMILIGLQAKRKARHSMQTAAP
jgi:hypothetical protein